MHFSEQKAETEHLLQIYTPQFLSILCLLRPNAFMYGSILMILMSHMLCFDQNRRRFGFDGPFVPLNV